MLKQPHIESPRYRIFMGTAFAAWVWFMIWGIPMIVHAYG